MRNTQLLDSTDLRILDLLRQVPKITQTRLAQELGVSQPWVATRIKHLEEKGILTISAGINLERLGLVTGAVGLTAEDPYDLVKKYRCCPYFLRGLVLSGRHNLTLDFCGENVSSLQGIVDQHIRREPGVLNVDFRLVTHVVGDMAVCPRLLFDRKEKSPCGSNCGACVQYESGSCVGCPATIFYKGTFWNGRNHQHIVMPQAVL